MLNQDRFWPPRGRSVYTTAPYKPAFDVRFDAREYAREKAEIACRARVERLTLLAEITLVGSLTLLALALFTGLL